VTGRPGSSGPPVPDPAPLGPAERWLATLAVMLVATMQVLDSTVTNVALPHMQGSLSASMDEITWIFTSFLAANAVILPATGWLTGLLGRRRFFFASTGLFLASSLASGAAPTLEVLVGARLLQGVGGGPLIPLSQAILMEIFPPRDRGMAMAVWGLGVMLAPILGPTVGGWLTDQYSWRWIFYLNVPIGAVALVLAWLWLPEGASRRPAAGRVDGVGLGLMVLGIGALQVALDRGERLDWFDSEEIVGLVAAGGAALAAFVAWELRARDPVVDLRVLGNRTFAVGTLLAALMGFGLYSSFVLLAFYLGALLRYDAWTMGTVMAPGGVGSLISLLVVGRLVNRVDPRWLVSVGAAVIAWSLWLMGSLSLAVDFQTVLWSRFVQGLGMGLVFVPLTTMSLAAVAPGRLPTASGIFNLVRNVGGSAGIAVLSTLLARHTQAHQADLVGRVTPFDPAAASRLAALAEAYRAAGADPFGAPAQALRHLYGEVQRQAAMKAFVDDFRLLALLFVAFVPLVWLMGRADRPGRPAAPGLPEP
jgi:DHA2 family multidrug resistance protein